MGDGGGQILFSIIAAALQPYSSIIDFETQRIQPAHIRDGQARNQA